MAILHNTGGYVKAPKQSSAKVHSAAGSGSRPVMSKHMIMTTSPKMASTLDSRKVKGALK